MEDLMKEIPTVELFYELGNRGFYVEQKEYFNLKNLMSTYGVKEKKAGDLVKEFAAEVKKGEFYKPLAYIKYSNKIWEVHKNSFRHFLKYRDELKDKNLRKYVPKYSSEDFM